MLRIQQCVLIIATLLLSWLLMQDVHELGHMAAAWMSGGRVTNVILDPFSISRTDVEPNPHPLVVVWGGPIVGALLPMGVWTIFKTLWRSSGFLKFLAGFCLIANGAYIGAGSIQRIGDCGEMLRHGSPIWLLWLFGLFCVAAGLWVWNGVGVYFGLGKDAPQIRGHSIAFTVIALVVVAMFGLILSEREMNVRRETRELDAAAQKEIQARAKQPMLEKTGKQ
ncbi:MAG TPA: hypothetical protein VMJ32_02800 [Pirellulales bacterium]|nr:hypothetical protein [Pirellulales bacterium]